MSVAESRTRLRGALLSLENRDLELQGSHSARHLIDSLASQQQVQAVLRDILAGLSPRPKSSHVCNMQPRVPTDYPLATNFMSSVPSAGLEKCNRNAANSRILLASYVLSTHTSSVLASTLQTVLPSLVAYLQHQASCLVACDLPASLRMTPVQATPISHARCSLHM